MRAFSPDVLEAIGAICVLAITIWASADAILHKRDVHASISWAALIWLAPVVGAVAYLLLGRNRIRRRAVELRSTAQRTRSHPHVAAIRNSSVGARFGGGAPQLSELATLMEETSSHPLLPGNRIAELENGDHAYPDMLQAIAGAQRSIALSTYIFESSPVGMRFVDALAAANARGVQVRVLVDYFGALYSWPSVARRLRELGVTVARFLPIWRARYFNLRDHRKLLVIDGSVGFTGGMNIRAGHVLGDQPRSPIRDLHFRVEGPCVAQLMEAFAEDWEFTTRESLHGQPWFPPLPEVGSSLARAIPDGPDQDIDRIRWAFLGGIACARKSIRVLTPYFLPDMSLATAFNVAAMRGVSVDIVVPLHGNLPLVQWAMWGTFEKVLGHGCRVWLTPAPFDHAKLMVVDDLWCLLGTANWDPRSLRLNFEIGLECYDGDFATRMSALIDARIAHAAPVREADLKLRPLSLRLRDGIARLFTPYL